MNSINATQARANFQSLISRAEYKGERILTLFYHFRERINSG